MDTLEKEQESKSSNEQVNDHKSSSTHAQAREVEINLTPVFSGPLDLLLNLLSKKQLDITEISIVKVVDEFIEEMNKMFSVNLGAKKDKKTSKKQNKKVSKANAHKSTVSSAGTPSPSDINDQFISDVADPVSEFLFIASILLNMKTHALLPKNEVNLENELLYIKQKDLLLSRLMQYKAFKEMSYDFKKRYEKRGEWYNYSPVKLEVKDEVSKKNVQVDIDVNDLFKIALEVFKEKKINLDHVTYVNVSIEDELKHISKKIFEARKLTFRELIEDANDIQHVVVRFLALLEMHKMQKITFTQNKSFDPIVIKATDKG